MEQLLRQGLKSLGLDEDPALIRKLALYAARLVEKNRVMNLTAITEPEQIVRLHFLDSLALLGAADMRNSRVIDVGCGAGFPGLVLKLAEESIDLTLLDSLKKRIDWLRELTTELSVQAGCVHARAEEQAKLPGYFEFFDFAVSRAVARLNVLCELCLPFVKIGGSFLAMKSANSDEEIREAETAMAELGGALEKVVEYTIPGTDAVHRAVVIKKIGTTPVGFPRRFSKIKQEPL